MPEMLILVAVIAVVAIVLVSVFFRYVPLGLWINARASGAPVKISSLIGMRFRRISPQKIVNAYIKARKAGLDVTTDMLETHFLAGGNVERVINALISAKQASINLSFTTACAIDLAGRDVLQAVQMSVLPKVIETPPVAAVAQDGIELRAKARVTVRTNIERLVGGAGEETIIARVGEGIVTTIGSSITIRPCWRTPTPSPRPCWKRAWTRAPLTKSFPLILPTSTWAATSARSCRPTRPKPTAVSLRRRQKSAAPWPWPMSRK